MIGRECWPVNPTEAEEDEGHPKDNFSEGTTIIQIIELKST
jgi:hypothetical protein